MSDVWADLTRAAVDEMVADGHAPEKIRTTPFLMMRYTGRLEDVEVISPLAEARTPEAMRQVVDQFGTVYAKINHRVSRYGEAGFTVAELGVIATADKVKPSLVKRPLGGPDQAYLGGRWHRAELFEMDLLMPGHEVTGPAIVEHPATTLVVHPGDRVFVDEWTLLHYRYA